MLVIQSVKPTAQLAFDWAQLKLVDSDWLSLKVKIVSAFLPAWNFRPKERKQIRLRSEIAAI